MKRKSILLLINNEILVFFRIIRSWYLSEPSSMVQHLKLQQDFGQFVEVLDDPLGLWHFQEFSLLFEDFHGFLDATVELSSPGYLP